VKEHHSAKGKNQSTSKVKGHFTHKEKGLPKLHCKPVPRMEGSQGERLRVENGRRNFSTGRKGSEDGLTTGRRGGGKNLQKMRPSKRNAGVRGGGTLRALVWAEDGAGKFETVG